MICGNNLTGRYILLGTSGERQGLSLDRASLECRDLPVSDSHVLELKVYATMPGLPFHLDCSVSVETY